MLYTHDLTSALQQWSEAYAIISIRDEDVGLIEKKSSNFPKATQLISDRERFQFSLDPLDSKALMLASRLQGQNS